MFDFEIIWMSSQIIRMSSFWKRVHNSKEIVNLQGLLVLTVDYGDMTTYPLTKYYYITERVYFIYKSFTFYVYIRCIYLSLHFHSCSFYVQYHGGRREITSMPE